MYIPDAMKMDSMESIHNFIEEFSFAALVSDRLEGEQLPLLLKKTEGDQGTLYGHFSRANKHLNSLGGKQVLVIFQGPHDYISPRWYASRPAVPTWNYATAHALGEIHLLSAGETVAVVEEAVHQYEPSLTGNQDIIPDEYRDMLIRGIVGFKIVITRLEGKLKLGQHRKAADQLGVVDGLQASASPQARALLGYMQKIATGMGG
ncbi:FMN-binding negative transcriptional regulator [Shewanella sp. AS16]|uniref:FMN-binding negative transcriptional regulator n=1 Tax=Shewanella sp. AS16 TaxID=2907625 RepID=UPI001F489D70|nr:FMN-binding negative transcriptional regulator [Shewanella sp. AS16]MCE9687145.1 FMN-binding negative transcriptional regulator [Shewanella sp. AS16]